MGAAIFYDYEDDPGGMNLKAAFRRARDDTAWEHGHGGYTGTIAEKHDVIVISSLAHAYDAAVRKADALIRAGDRRIDDKWGARRRDPGRRAGRRRIAALRRLALLRLEFLLTGFA